MTNGREETLPGRAPVREVALHIDRHLAS